MDQETKILIGLIVLFAAGAAGTLLLDAAPVLTAVCVCLVVTACLYRFLGGVEGSRFVVASFRAGGSVAVFAAAMWYVTGELNDWRSHVEPAPGEWIAMDGTGAPMDLRIGGDTIAGPDASEFLQKATWGIRSDSGGLRVTAGARDLALIRFPSLGSLGLFDRIEMVEGRGLRYTDDLDVGMEADLYPPYPYRIRADGFGDSYNGFSVMDRIDGTIVSEGSLRTKSFQFFEHAGSHFLVFVSRAVHNDPASGPRAAFGFAQVKLTLDGPGSGNRVGGLPGPPDGRGRGPHEAPVAFSGEHDYGGERASEAGLNSLPSSRIAETFRKDPHRSLGCADKFQTGCVEPLLQHDGHGQDAFENLGRSRRFHASTGRTRRSGTCSRSTS